VTASAVVEFSELGLLTKGDATESVKLPRVRATREK
jgi:hypothetical protein